MTWDIAFSYIRHVTLWKISDRDIGHCHFLNLTCNIGDPPSRAPILMEVGRGGGANPGPHPSYKHENQKQHICTNLSILKGHKLAPGSIWGLFCLLSPNCLLDHHFLPSFVPHRFNYQPLGKSIRVNLCQYNNCLSIHIITCPM